MNRRLPPYRSFLASDSQIRDLLRSHRTIAFCGLSGRPDDGSLDAARELKQRGYRVIPVNADEPEVLGVASAADLSAVTEEIGIVLVWRGVTDAAALVELAATAGAAAVWFDVGAEDPEAAYLASQRGMTAVLGRRIVGEYEMHFPDDELGIDDGD